MKTQFRAGGAQALSPVAGGVYASYMRPTVVKFLSLIPPLALLAACASFGESAYQRTLALALQDDQACIQKGWRYPDPPYVSCRMQLQDDRLHQDWLNLQVMRQTQVQPPNVPTPATPREIYRPLDPNHFDCHPVTEVKHDYILCDATDEKPQKP
jgi:hypothetical protein